MNARIKMVDCAGVRDEREFWVAYARGVQVDQPGFGRNLDAFRDALWGGPGWPEADEVRFIHSCGVASLQNGTFIAMLRKIALEVGTVRLTFDSDSEPPVTS
ncbi:barstar family protein [Deinococcus arboris]|nr:barstar family protein [Deinococcus arboris]